MPAVTHSFEVSAIACARAYSPHTPYNPVQLKQQQKCRMIVGAPCMYAYAHFELESIYICLSLNQMKYFNHIAEK